MLEAIKEVFAMSALKSHPNLLTYFTSWMEDSRLYIVTGGYAVHTTHIIKIEVLSIRASTHAHTHTNFLRVLCGRQFG